MFHLNDDRSAAFFKPVADVKYVVGMSLPRVIMDSSEKFIDLALMYSKSSSCDNPVHCLDILIDEKGVKYAKLSCTGIKYALSIGSSLIPKKESLKNMRSVNLSKADSVAVPESLNDSSLEDKIKNYDSLDEIGGISNVDHKYAQNIVIQHFHDQYIDGKFFLN
jgi:hypothetical protein